MLIVVFLSLLFIVTTIDLPNHHDLDLSGLSLASTKRVANRIATNCDPLSHGPHVDCHFPFPLFLL